VSTEEMLRVMELVVAHRAPALPATAVGELLEQIAACLDGGADAARGACRRWLASDDRDRVEIALAMERALAGLSRDERAALAATIGARWPDLAARCAEIAAR
jgi:hypothetical protein